MSQGNTGRTFGRPAKPATQATETKEAVRTRRLEAAKLAAKVEVPPQASGLGVTTVVTPKKSSSDEEGLGSRPLRKKIKLSPRAKAAKGSKGGRMPDVTSIACRWSGGVWHVSYVFGVWAFSADVYGSSLRECLFRCDSQFWEWYSLPADGDGGKREGLTWVVPPPPAGPPSSGPTPPERETVPSP